MNEFGDFLKVLAEGKKEKQEKVAEATKELGDFLGVVAEAKAADPKHQMLKEVKKHVQEDIVGLFSQLSQAKPVSVEKIEQLVEAVEIIEQIENPEIVGEFVLREDKFLDPVTLTEVVVPEVRPAAEMYTKAEIDDLLKRNASFQQPDPKKADPNIKGLQEKLKFLEQAIGKIAATGPGSGEVNFRWLDDVNRATMNESNNNWILEYDAATKKVQFTNDIGPVNNIVTESASITSLTENRVVLVGEGGELVDSPDVTFDGVDFNINGNLTVNGDITYANTTALDITDKNITIAKGAISAIAADGAGITVDGANAHITYKQDTDRWVIDKTVTPSTNYDLDLGELDHQYDQFFANNANLKSIKLNTLGPQDALVPGMISWNSDEDCVDVSQSDGTRLQVGLEQYIRVHNHTGSALYNGDVVMFAGVENTNAIAMPVVSKFIANGSVQPLLLIGVLTTDLPANGIGRATTFGYVRNLNTTGSHVGETWAQGDLLWGHPTIPGALTKVRPTAPNVATSVAAVVRVGTTDGQLLVRPTIFPRLYFGDWYSTQNQTHALPNTAYKITINNTGTVSGFTNNNGTITALHAGLYNFQFSLQVISSNSSAAYYWIWYRKNGQDVANSATKLSISSNTIILAPSWNFPVSMLENDTFELMWACDTANKVSLLAEGATAFCPAIPSVILTVQQTNL